MSFKDSLHIKLEEEIKEQIVQRIHQIYRGLELVQKKIKNRTPDKLKFFAGKFVFPYITILIIVAYVLIANFAHAAENTNFMVSDEVMDLQPAEVASVVNSVSPYTPVLKTDPIQVALAMQDNDFVQKPNNVFETVITEQPKPVATPAPANRTATTNYTVQSGDTLSSIGWTYGLKVATIKATNGLTADSIKLGQTLKLPTADLSPDAIKQVAAKAAQKKVAGAATKAIKRPPGSSNNAYPYGWCTYYVATKRYVPGSWGDAKSWLSSAKRAGYPTGSEPAAGAIVVTTESWWGHVAYVESVSGGNITISEMNAVGWGVRSTRVLPAHAGKIRGYIY